MISDIIYEHTKDPFWILYFFIKYMQYMPKILILILIANYPVFLDNFKELRAHYLRVSKLYNIPIQVVGYVGGSDTTYFDDETDILHIGCNDRMTAMKLIYAADFIRNNMDYDFMLKTNASTIVNLRLMYRMMRDPMVLWNRIYNKSFKAEYRIGDESEWFEYACGTYAVCTKDTFNTLFTDSNTTNNHLDALRKHLIDNKVNIYNDTWGCIDVMEDTFFGYLAKIYGIDCYSLYEDLVVDTKYREGWINHILDIAIDNMAITPSVICKTGDFSDIDKRTSIEPSIIHLVGMLFESVSITDTQYRDFYKTNLIENRDNGMWNETNIYVHKI